MRQSLSTSIIEELERLNVRLFNSNERLGELVRTLFGGSYMPPASEQSKSAVDGSAAFMPKVADGLGYYRYQLDRQEELLSVLTSEFDSHEPTRGR